MAKKEIRREPIIEIFDDLDDKPLPSDTKAARYQFNTGAFDLYLSKENKGKVDKFIKDLTDGAEKAVGPSSSSNIPAVPPYERDRRKKAYNAAHPNSKAKRYSKRVHEWYLSKSK